MWIGKEPGNIVNLIIWHSKHVSVHVCETVVSPWNQSTAKIIHHIDIHTIKGCLATNTPASYQQLLMITHLYSTLTRGSALFHARRKKLISLLQTVPFITELLTLNAGTDLAQNSGGTSSLLGNTHPPLLSPVSVPSKSLNSTYK